MVFCSSHLYRFLITGANFKKKGFIIQKVRQNLTPSPRQKKIRHEQQRNCFLEKIGSPGSLLFSNSALPLHWPPKTRDALRQQRGRFRGDSRRCLWGKYWGKCTVRRIHIYLIGKKKTFATLYNKYQQIWNLSIPRRKSLL